MSQPQTLEVMMIERRYARWALMACLLGGWMNSLATGAQGRDPMAEQRNQMVDEVIVGGGIKNPRVIQAMRDTPRHEFMPTAQRRYAYYDMALPIGESQTISPPFVVAYMTELLDPQPTDKVLEIGTGSGYQAAVLSGLVADVYTIEIVDVLGRRAAQTLKRLKYENVHTRIGDGYLGWPEVAPLDKIIVTCSPEKVPQPLIDQLKEGGRIVIPVGQRYEQTIYLLTKKDGKMETESLRPTLFVPMTGRAEDERKILPDPANPTVNNGGFEDITAAEPESADANTPAAEAKRAPVGWHYQRQMELITENAPEGSNYVTMRNTEPGRPAQALQGFAVDGRKVRLLDVSLMVRGRDLRPGRNIDEQPMAVITFYDERRATVSDQVIGPFRGSFEWQLETQRIAVPARAREAILRLSLMGATGEISFDAVSMAAVK